MLKKIQGDLKDNKYNYFKSKIILKIKGLYYNMVIEYNCCIGGIYGRIQI